jgi:hypothetical protein
MAVKYVLEQDIISWSGKTGRSLLQLQSCHFEPAAVQGE